MKYVFKKRGLRIAAQALDAVGYSVAGFWKRSGRRPDPSSWRTALLVRLDHLGDVLTATSLPRILKRHRSEIRVFFLTSSAGAELLRHNPFVDETLILDAPWFSRKQADARAWPEIPALVSRLSKMSIDLAIAPRGDLRENLLMAAAGIPERLGYGITGGGFLLTRSVPYRADTHESEHALDLLRALDIGASDLKPEIYFSDDEKEEFKKKRELWGLSATESAVGFQLEAGTPAKDWGLENAARFLNSFSREYPHKRVVLIGSETARKRAEALRGNACLNLAGKTTVRDLCLLLPGFSLFIGPDSGPAHLACALGVPTCFLYSGTNVFEQWRPLGENARVLRREVPCSPCGLKQCTVAGHPCMSRIRPEELLQEVKGCLK